MPTLREHDNWLYVVHEDPSWGEPVLLRLWYPLGIRILPGQRDLWEPALGQEMRATGVADYQGMRDGRHYQLPDGGQTRPEFSESEPIPRPRGECRWYCGRWERYSKNRGWRPA
jgi:hypothetical protein